MARLYACLNMCAIIEFRRKVTWHGVLFGVLVQAARLRAVPQQGTALSDVQIGHRRRRAWLYIGIADGVSGCISASLTACLAHGHRCVDTRNDRPRREVCIGREVQGPLRMAIRCGRIVSVP